MSIGSKVVSLLNIYVLLLTDAMITCVATRSVQNSKLDACGNTVLGHDL
jgi:hypothetical protein